LESLIILKSLEARKSTGKMRNKKYHTVGTVPKSKNKIIEKGKIYTLNTEISLMATVKYI
jgi:hypothetical protein